ncbi:SSU ribosomal protein S20P [Neorhodopirellula lusitana]|uniref:Small ribosomal subunit protein bS20 n=1 Tax=Neorhodopirellula lusitana TaxID=445327 RepID=A0ABY1PVI5_9BACT|nr:30S ribosomal protein S20 [Neorhodopirellula lusitana]SMP50129.1 SSU ribosomal protein S20P [Neorhodopirellula lusitana]
MPNTASSIKRLRQNDVRRLRNRATRSTMRAAVKRVRAAVEANDAETAKNEFKMACRKLDQAAAKNVIHKNAASRTKSRLNGAIKKIAQAA